MIIKINNKDYDLNIDPNMPLLWVLRDILGLTGTKYGCGVGDCGSCMVLVDSVARKSCILPVSQIVGKSITTIEGLSSDASHIVQKAWIEAGVPQCGYCQPGQIMSAVGLLIAIPKPTDDDINNAMSANICRCGTYSRIRAAIHIAAKG